MAKYYAFRYKKKFFSKVIKAVGHRWDKDSDRMDVYHLNGSITSIAKWSTYNLYLGTDWVLFTKNAMEKESGQNVKLAVDVAAG
jgi:hypothetical protein